GAGGGKSNTLPAPNNSPHSPPPPSHRSSRYAHHAPQPAPWGPRYHPSRPLHQLPARTRSPYSSVCSPPSPRKSRTPRPLHHRRLPRHAHHSPPPHPAPRSPHSGALPRHHQPHHSAPDHHPRRHRPCHRCHRQS